MSSRPSRDVPWLKAARVGALVVYAAAFAWSVQVWGLPYEREVLLAWFVGALAMLALLSPGRRVGRLIVDWLPFVLLLLAYDYTRGAAEKLGFPLHVTPQITADRWLGFGQVPTVWLQERLYDPYEVHVWEVVPTLVYLSHFIAPYAVAAWLYGRSRDRWVAFTGRFLSLTLVSLLTYIVLPWAPPWYAARRGLLPRLHRTVGRGWEYLPIHSAQNVFDKGQATVNLTAALPSLHAAYTMLITCFFWRTSCWPLRVLLVTYPLLMAFTLVASAEHYVVDILLGWVFAWGVHVGWLRIDAWRAHSKELLVERVEPEPDLITV